MRFAFTLVAIRLLTILVISGNSQTPATPTTQSLSADVTEESRLNAAMIDLFKQEKFDDALRIGKELLSLRERMFGVTHVKVANSLSDLAELYLAAEKYPEAERSHLRALAILEKQQPVDPLMVSLTLQRLGDLKFRRREYESSAEYLRRALTLRESAAAPNDDSSTLAIMHSLANAFQMLRKFDEAEDLYVKSLTAIENKLGREHSTVVARMKDYACLKPNSLEFRKDPSETKQLEDPDRDLRYRAVCWLYGFKNDCATALPAEFKPDALLNGRAITLPKPDYPEGARRARAQGKVIVAVAIDERGNVSQARPICGGPPLLHKAATDAARGAKFSPTMLDGKPVAVTGHIVYNFVAW